MLKIILIVYGISITIILSIIIYNQISDIRSGGRFKLEEPLYGYALIFLFAPLTVLFIPIAIIIEQYDNRNKEKEEAKRKAKREAEEQIEEAKAALAVENYKCAEKSFYTKEFYDVANQLRTLVNASQYNLFLSCLDKLSLPKGSHLCVKEAQHVDIGDTSKLYIDNFGKKDKKIWEYLRIEDSPMGAWQAYLINEIWHTLPTFWHGGYHRRKYVFSTEDCFDIKPLNAGNEDYYKSRFSKLDVTPIIAKNNDKYYVSACYWTNWGGLIRELIEITIKDNKVIQFYEADIKTLLKYDCRVWY